MLLKLQTLVLASSDTLHQRMLMNLDLIKVEQKFGPMLQGSM